MDWKESWSYFISLLSFLISKIPHTCEDWTGIFTLLIVFVTFFFITLPRAKQLKKENENEEKNETKKDI